MRPCTRRAPTREKGCSARLESSVAGCRQYSAPCSEAVEPLRVRQGRAKAKARAGRFGVGAGVGAAAARRGKRLERR